jgi:hypothetical protein
MGLWGIANYEGVLEDRPRRIKTQVLPYDDCDIDRLLNQLIQHEFIVRRTIEAKSYIFLPTFHVHQNPHKKERDAKNSLPAASRFEEDNPKDTGHIREFTVSNKQANCKEEFDVFWGEYPRKTGREEAERIWNELNPDCTQVEIIVSAVKDHSISEQWSQDNGRYIPNPANWLKQKRWNDQFTKLECVVAEVIPQEGNPFQ